MGNIDLDVLSVHSDFGGISNVGGGEDAVSRQGGKGRMNIVENAMANLKDMCASYL